MKRLRKDAKMAQPSSGLLGSPWRGPRNGQHIEEKRPGHPRWLKSCGSGGMCMCSRTFHLIVMMIFCRFGVSIKVRRSIVLVVPVKWSKRILMTAKHWAEFTHNCLKCRSLPCLCRLCHLYQGTWIQTTDSGGDRASIRKSVITLSF